MTVNEKKRKNGIAESEKPRQPSFRDPNDDAIEKLVSDKTEHYVVRIIAGTDKKIQQTEKSGTGFIINSAAFIVTCRHVIYEDPMSTVPLSPITIYQKDGKTIVGTATVFKECDKDIAVLQLDKVAKEKLNLMEDQGLAEFIKSPFEIKQGTAVVAVGFPHGENLIPSAGKVVGTSYQYSGLNNLILLQKCINGPGSSGGPVCISDGAIVGMVACMQENKEFVGKEVTVQGITYAIPAGDITKFLKYEGIGYTTQA